MNTHWGQLPRYRRSREVRALEISRIEAHPDDRIVLGFPGRSEALDLTAKDYLEVGPLKVGDFILFGDDGSRSRWPGGAFRADFELVG